MIVARGPRKPQTLGDPVRRLVGRVVQDARRARAARARSRGGRGSTPRCRGGRRRRRRGRRRPGPGPRGRGRARSRRGPRGRPARPMTSVRERRRRRRGETPGSGSSLDLGRELRPEAARVEERDGADPAPAGDEAGPGVGEVVPEGADGAEAGHDDGPVGHGANRTRTPPRRSGGTADRIIRPMSDRVDWHRYFMNIAAEVATRSTCPRKHVGAVDRARPADPLDRLQRLAPGPAALRRGGLPDGGRPLHRDGPRRGERDPAGGDERRADRGGRDLHDRLALLELLQADRERGPRRDLLLASSTASRGSSTTPRRMGIRLVDLGTAKG